MQICHLINDLSPDGGAQHLLCDLVLHDQNQDHRVLTLYPAEGSIAEKLQLKGVTVRSLLGGGAAGVKGWFMEMRGCDVIHAHLFPAWYLAVLIPHQKPTVYTEHSTTNRRRKIRMFRWVERWLIGRLTRICCISEGVTKSLEEWIGGGVKRILLTVENGVDLHKFGAKRAYRSKEGFLVGMTGRFTPQKDQATIIRALSQCPKEVTLILIGKGPNEDTCRSLARRLGLSSRVRFAGHIKRNELPEEYSQMDVYVQSSICEGFGLAPVEAMAAGVPVLATNVQGVDGVVNNSKAMFEVGDADGLSNNILRLKNNAGEWERASLHSLAQSSKYSLENMVAAYGCVYKEAVATEQAGRPWGSSLL